MPLVRPLEVSVALAVLCTAAARFDELVRTAMLKEWAEISIAVRGTRKEKLAFGNNNTSATTCYLKGKGHAYFGEELQ